LDAAWQQLLNTAKNHTVLRVNKNGTIEQMKVPTPDVNSLEISMKVGLQAAGIPKKILVAELLRVTQGQAITYENFVIAAFGVIYDQVCLVWWFWWGEGNAKNGVGLKGRKQRVLC
jgi:hypothetical protein